MLAALIRNNYTGAHNFLQQDVLKRNIKLGNDYCKQPFMHEWQNSKISRSLYTYSVTTTIRSFLKTRKLLVMLELRT